jgi:hypothetical protein
MDGELCLIDLALAEVWLGPLGADRAGAFQHCRGSYTPRNSALRRDGRRAAAVTPPRRRRLPQSHAARGSRDSRVC